MSHGKDDGRSDEAQKETSAAGPQAPPKRDVNAARYPSQNGGSTMVQPLEI